MLRVGIQLLAYLKLVFWLELLDDGVRGMNFHWLDELNRFIQIIIEVIIELVNHLLRELKLLINQRGRLLSTDKNAYPNLGSELDSLRIGHPEAH